MLTILDYKDDRFERLMAWARYLHWADIHRRHFIAWIEAGHDMDDYRPKWEFIALLSAWYTSLWVVIEGWREVPLSDHSVDELLDVSPRYQKLLRRYRNGVFHYQPKLTDGRLIDFLNESDGTVYWTYLGHQEFCRFYWELIEYAPMPQLLSGIKDSIVGIVGWIPDDIPVALIESCRKDTAEAISILRKAGDFTSPAARDLLEAARQSTDIAAQAERTFRTCKASMLNRIKLNDSSINVGTSAT